MIRYSSSFFLSVLLHLLLFFVIFYFYQEVSSTPKKSEEKKVQISLCSLSTQPTIKEPTPKKVIQKTKVPPIKRIKTVQKKVLPKVVTPIKKPSPVSKPKIKEVKLSSIEEVIQVKKNPPVEIKPEKKYIDKHLQKISELLSDNLYYPRSARKRKIQGEIVVSFKLSSSSHVTDIKVISSNSEILSRAATKTIQKLSGLFPKPSKALVLQVPISYKLSK